MVFMAHPTYHCPSYLNAQDQKMVIQTLKLISLFYRDLTDEETRQDGPLFHNIMTWRKLFATSFYGQEPHYLHAVPGSKFNLRCPTLSSLLSVPDVIMFLGPCKFLDTSLFESMHYEWRLGQNAVNGLRNNRDIIQIAFARHQAKRCRFDGEFKSITEEVISLHQKKSKPKQVAAAVREYGTKVRINPTTITNIIAGIQLSYSEIELMDLLLPVTRRPTDWKNVKFFTLSGPPTFLFFSKAQ